MQRIISEINAAINAIVASSTPDDATFEAVVQPWIDIDNTTLNTLNVIANLQCCSPRLEKQEIVQDALKLWREAEAKWAAQYDYFQLLDAVLCKDGADPVLDDESRCVLNERVRRYKSNGYGVLDEAGVAAVLQNQLEATELCVEFQRNLAHEKGGLWFE